MDNNVKLFSGNSHPGLAELVAKRLGIQLSKALITKFSNQVNHAPSRCALFCACAKSIPPLKKGNVCDHCRVCP